MAKVRSRHPKEHESVDQNLLELLIGPRAGDGERLERLFRSNRDAFDELYLAGYPDLPIEATWAYRRCILSPSQQAALVADNRRRHAEDLEMEGRQSRLDFADYRAPRVLDVSMLWLVIGPPSPHPQRVAQLGTIYRAYPAEYVELYARCFAGHGPIERSWAVQLFGPPQNGGLPNAA